MIENVEVLHSCAYHTQKKHMSKEQDEEFKYPCLQNVNVKNVPSCIWYSSTNDKGHFGIPKVIFGKLGKGVLVDSHGDYGMSSDCSAIVDDVELLLKIQKAIQSEKFINIMKNANVGGMSTNIYDYRILKLFRKDFWKEFI